MVMGYPIIGDHFYGIAEDAEAKLMLLHAQRLEFTHPESGDRLVIEAEPDF